MFPFYLSLFHVVRAEQSQNLVRWQKPYLTAHFDELKMSGTFLTMPLSCSSFLLRWRSCWQCLPTKMQSVFAFISACQQRSNLSQLYLSFLSAFSQLYLSFISALSQLYLSFISACQQRRPTPHIVKFSLQRCRSTLMRLSTMFFRRTRSATYQGSISTSMQMQLNSQQQQIQTNVNLLRKNLPKA